MSAAAAITVVARWTVRSGDEGRVLELIEPLRQNTLAEPGCLGYEVFQAVDAAHQLLLLERYRDETAIEAHRNSPHYRELVVQQIVPLLAGRQVELLRAAEPG